MNNYKTFSLRNSEGEYLGEGVILPSGRTVIEWLGDDSTFVIYPCFADFKSIQDKQEGREIRFAGSAPDGHYLTTFKLVRKEDVTGVSGTGVVAYGCHFARGAVLEWNTEIKSISYYPKGIPQIERLHGHGGKSSIEMDFTPSW